MSVDVPLAARFHVAARVCAAAVVVLGVAVLAGWALDLQALKCVLPGLASMKANSALLFILLGVALLTAENPARRALRLCVGLFVTTVAAMTLLEYGLAVDFGIDELLFRDREPLPPNTPGRMAIASAVGFLLYGVVVGTFDMPAADSLRQGAVLAASGVAFVAVCGYLFGVQSLYSVFLYTSVALHTAVGFLLVTTAYALSPSQRLVRVLASDTVAGRLLRRLLPVILVLPVIVGELMLAWRRVGPFGVEFGVSIVVLSIVLSFGSVVWIVAFRLYRSEVAERDAYAELAERERKDIDDRKRDSERFRLALEAAPTGMLLVDRAGSIVLVNSQIERMFGYDRTALLGQPMEILVPDQCRAQHPSLRAQYDVAAAARPMGPGRDLFGLRSDGIEIPVEIGLTPIETSEGRVVLASIVDITERRRGEEERSRLFDELRSMTQELEQRVEARTRDLREREVRYRALFDESPVALWEKDYSATLAFLQELGPLEQVRARLVTQADLVETAAAKVRIVDVNRRGLELFGADAATELAKRWSETLGPEGYDAVVDELLAVLDGWSHFETEGERRTLAGQPLHVRVQSTTIPAAAARVIVSMVDITASKEAERALRDSMGRQEVLLREIHHRVKNNLAVIASLFYLESTHTTDARAVALLEDSRRRIRSMALVHETLYRSDNLASIDMAEYAHILAHEVKAAYRPPMGCVRLTTDLQPVSLDVELAVPCGLILNELVSNAFKHAFPGGRSGSVHVSLRECGATCILRVIDDGVGLPTDLNVATHHSLGLRLVRLLVKQLGGTLDLERRDPGTDGRVTFTRSHNGC